MKKLIKESGIRDINALAKRYPKAEIYFHQDLDGVTTAIAMREYLENNGIKVVGAHVIQYGDKEFAVKKNDASGDTMPVLVDFAHGKQMFVIHTDQVARERLSNELFLNLDCFANNFVNFCLWQFVFNFFIECACKVGMQSFITSNEFIGSSESRH